MRSIYSFILSLVITVGVLEYGLAQSEGPFRKVVNVVGNLTKPEELKFTEAHLKQLTLPSGFEAQIFAKDLKNPRMMVVKADGTVLVSRPKQGDILALTDKNHDGVVDATKTVISGFEHVHGLALKDQILYFIALKQIYQLDLAAPTPTPKLLVDSLPDGGQHENRSIAIGPDAKLYVHVGSTCNSCDDTNKESATLVRTNLEGQEREVFAKGLRDTIGFDWQPGTGALYGFDHGVDWRGDDIPPEELNLLVKDGNYGWPFCYANKLVDENLIANPKDFSKKDYCSTTTAPLLTYKAHSAPMALKFYQGKSFPVSYQNSAFVAMHGSWNRKDPSGYKVVRIKFEKDKPVGFEDFMTGFLSDDGRSQFGRPVGLAFLADGSMLVSDDGNGVIYRVTYKGKH